MHEMVVMINVEVYLGRVRAGEFLLNGEISNKIE